jgi:tubby and related proteins
MEEEKVESGGQQEKKTARNDKDSVEEEDEDAGFLDDAPLYYQPGIVPQAPLKPSQKDAYDAFISKLLNPYLPLEELRDLYMKPLPALIG